MTSMRKIIRTGVQWVIAVAVVAAIFVPQSVSAQATNTTNTSAPQLENCPSVARTKCSSEEPGTSPPIGNTPEYVAWNEANAAYSGCMTVETEECIARNKTVTDTINAEKESTYLIPQCARTTGSCSICDILVFFGKIGEVILRFLSSIVILMVVIGGVFWISSAGNSERVDRGKQIMLGALMGSVMVFLGFVIVNLTMIALLGGSGKGSQFGIVSPFGGSVPWNQYCEQAVEAPGSSPETAYDTIGSCKGAANGAKCDTDGCDEPGKCICNNEKCVPTCATLTASQYLFRATGMCESDEDFCKQYSPGPNGQPNGIVESRPEFACPSSLPVCCIIGGDPTRVDSTTGKSYLEWKGN